jgi:hypothetical protein
MIYIFDGNVIRYKAWRINTLEILRFWVEAEKDVDMKWLWFILLQWNFSRIWLSLLTDALPLLEHERVGDIRKPTFTSQIVEFNYG